MGAKPLYLSCALIIEEGFDLANLERILCSLASVAKNAGLCVVCGDTKVVPKGACDGIFINTSAIGELIDESLPASTKRLKSASPEKKINFDAFEKNLDEILLSFKKQILELFKNAK